MAEVTVRGGGIFGLSIAYECARRGARVRLVERDRIGAGASGGLVGALAPHVPEQWNAKKQFQLDSLLMAERFWAGVAALSGCDPLYARTGRLQPLADQAAVDQARQRAVGAATHWQGRADWAVVEGAGPWGAESPTGLWVFDSLTARLHPRRACMALAAAIRALGGDVVEGAGPQDHTATGPQDHAATGPLDHPATGPVIWATGHQGLTDLGHALGRPVGNGVKGQAALLAFAAADRPQLFIDGLHLVPHGDGTLAVGSTSERDWNRADATDEGLEALVARARAAVPALWDAPVIDRWAGLRPRAISRAPVLDVWPDRPGHFIANGGFKIGFGMAPMVASTMADLVLDGQDRVPSGFRLGQTGA